MKTLSTTGEAMIEGFEALRLVGYPDVKGVPTAGWGHTGHDVMIGTTYTREQCEDWFVADTQKAIDGVNTGLDAPCTQNQFDALVSFTYNVGVNAEAHSTMLKLMNAGNVAGAAAEFPKWDHVDGVPNAGLLRRRKAEQALFLA